mmetsp:Transcript_22324/g.56451  ORF Transcript_22324/g.56451 Transcript_22324/m.56451 type:complete len:464 (-) Transcript_22324:40-1431(-)|eukprot:CAMPEP_0178996442 /NCGR_PEP_ID=MMETSP0795-20121207/8368_1 /TAXON_ID=88552 /ORGANISM="Amoebophrya sp., Strain Ameob2" /LENGTH=463 /DNA_ID=CAMNT_0020688827 /DNA_START=300 /DNA_END=1691 /DNA_ORIENTATION=-
MSALRISGGFIAGESLINASGYLGQIVALKLFILRYDFPYALWLTFFDQLLCAVAILVTTHVFRLMPDPEILPPLLGSKFASEGKPEDLASARSRDPTAPRTSSGRPTTTRVRGRRRYYGFWTEIFPLGVMNVFSGATHYGSHLFLFPSFTEMIQMTTTVPQLLAAVFIQKKSLSPLALLSIAPITVGGVMCAFGEVNFDVIGIALSVSAVLIGVARRTFVEEVMARGDREFERQQEKDKEFVSVHQQPGEKDLVPQQLQEQEEEDREEELDQKSPLATSWGMAYRITPFNVVGLFLLSLLLEGPDPWRKLGPNVVDSDRGLSLLLAKGGATTAWYITEFILVHHAGAFFVAIQYTVSRSIVIVATLLIFRNPIATLQIYGLGLTLVGVAMYLADKRRVQPPSAGVGVTEQPDLASGRSELKTNKSGEAITGNLPAGDLQPHLPINESARTGVDEETRLLSRT